ncbi:efflux RND transporter periplasmic adaptor subunit [Bauldia sp.]|uniref:efflux RND transporter periplasmic adaptor subunit n=1 Tax=Bauldia sp. TaxID=2575872 RepID=UPI003BA98A96
MASSIFKPSRVLSVLIVLAAAGWIASGALSQSEGEETDDQAIRESEVEAPVLVQKVAVSTIIPETHQRQFTLSCTTEADQQSVAVARGAGVITDLNVKRGSNVRAGDVIATLSDEGRDAAVKQAEALLEQRRAEYEANKALIDSGNTPRNQLPALEAAVAAAEATLASAEAESDRSLIRSPINGVVDDVPVQVGQAIQPGAVIAEVIDPDPMLAVGFVSERERGFLQLGQTASVRFINGSNQEAEVTFVGLSADTATRTYPVEAHMDNADARIADGVTCEMTVSTQPIEAAPVPRSALVFSDDGVLGIRAAADDDRAHFMPVSIVDDGRELVWVDGIDSATQVIVVGQDFVKDGDRIEAVSTVAEADTDIATEPEL